MRHAGVFFWTLFVCLTAGGRMDVDAWEAVLAEGLEAAT